MFPNRTEDTYVFLDRMLPKLTKIIEFPHSKLEFHNRCSPCHIGTYLCTLFCAQTLQVKVQSNTFLLQMRFLSITRIIYYKCGSRLQATCTSLYLLSSFSYNVHYVPQAYIQCVFWVTRHISSYNDTVLPIIQILDHEIESWGKLYVKNQILVFKSLCRFSITTMNFELICKF